jgi:hypothetical protein
MTLRIKSIMALTFSVFSVAAAAQELPPLSQNKVASSGERTRVGIAYDLNPDCTPTGELRIRLVEPPKNGVAEIVKEQGVTRYPKDSQMNKCNEKLSDIQAFYYQSQDGFKGKDRFTTEGFSHNGAHRKRIFNIDVR